MDGGGLRRASQLKRRPLGGRGNAVLRFRIPCVRQRAQFVGDALAVTLGEVLHLAEGLEETLALHRLGVFPALGVSCKATNLIASVLARLEAKTQRGTRWRTRDQTFGWCASAWIASQTSAGHRSDNASH